MMRGHGLIQHTLVELEPAQLAIRVQQWIVQRRWTSSGH
jgi:hypothetical protein